MQVRVEEWKGIGWVKREMVVLQELKRVICGTDAVLHVGIEENGKGLRALAPRLIHILHVTSLNS